MKKTTHATAVLLIATSCLYAAPVFATEQTEDPYQDYLLGGGNGLRDYLGNYGIDPTLQYKGDFFSNVSGGIKRGNNYLDNLDIRFDIDNEKLMGLKGNKAVISFVNNFGAAPNENLVGSVQGVDNIETSTNTFKLYELWTEQSMLEDKLAVLVGLRDLNAEFAQTDMTGNFIKPTMQLGQSFAQSGLNGPSVFPNTSLAARVKVMPVENTYLSAAVFDGVPGDPNRPHGTEINLRPRDGLLMVAEAGYTPNAPDAESVANKFAVGAWTYSKHMDDLVAVDGNGDPLQKRMMGAYVLSSYEIYNEAAKSLGIFLRAGIADGDTAQVDWDYETGMVAHGFIAARPDGEIGAGLSQSHNSNKFMESMGGVADRNEYSLELYYRDQIMRGVALQPDIQYVINPGTDRVTKNATILGARIDINF